jgi:MerR family transcriptional regulator, light-induced transcriptional regulator
MESLPQEHATREVAPSRTAAPPERALDLPEFRPAEAANDTRMSQLARTIELEIIPRLMLAHRSASESASRAVPLGTTVTVDDVHGFTRLVLSQDEDAAYAAIHGFRKRDISVERLYVELLAPTARYLGELWDEDLCSFTDVTVGLGRLQRVLRELSPALGHSVEHAARGRRVLLLPSPGEQHTFGLVMVAEFFRRAGWDVTGGAWAAGADAAALVAGEWFDAVGFSLAVKEHLPVLAESITAVRHASCNRGIAVVVGGPIFVDHPEYVMQAGADGMTIDGREAPLLVECVIDRHAKIHVTGA